jgi:hypothetical protein
MCFALYAGTIHPLRRSEWNMDTPDLSVQSLTEREIPVRGHFTTPEVQYIGSTSGCGCDFPFVMLQGGAWPYFEDPDKEKDMVERDHYNRQALVNLLHQTGEKTIELYGVWDGEHTKPPQAREDIPLKKLLDPNFRFKEQGFYKISVE